MDQNSNSKYDNFKKYLKIIISRKCFKLLLVFGGMLLASVIMLVKPKFFQLILDEGILKSNKEIILKLCLSIFALQIVSAILNTCVNTFFSKLKRRSSNVLRNTILKHIGRQTGKYFSEKKTGELLYILENDLFNIENFGIDWLFTSAMNIITALTSLIILITINNKLVIIVLIIQIILLVTNIKVNSVIAESTKKVRDTAGDISTILEEYIANAESIVISKGIGFLWKKIFNKERKFLRETITLDFIMTISNQCYTILNSLLIVFVYLVGGLGVIKGNMTIGEIIAFTQYTNLLLGPCMSLLQNNTRIQQVLVSIDRVFNVINLKTESKFIYAAEKKGEKIMNYDIEFRKVNFGYDEQNLLNKFDMLIRNGEIAAVVGRSGSGKTTLAKLIFKLWSVKSGTILIGGQDINKLNIYELRKDIEYISQDVFLFDDSFINNLVLDQKNIKEEYVREICEKVGIWDLINKQQEGLNTIIGERGMKLSGGEKQRISIARGLLRNSKILILDEATSALDNISQSNLLNQIRPFIKDKTVLIIAHRLSTIINADHIWVMDNGKVVEHGTHESLLKENNLYYQLLEEENLNKSYL